LNALVADLLETMQAAQGAGLAAPQIGVDLQLVVFGFESSARYPDAPPVPGAVLLNPVIGSDHELGRCWASCTCDVHGISNQWHYLKQTPPRPAARLGGGLSGRHNPCASTMENRDAPLR
jgi:peptide deformylase